MPTRTEKTTFMTSATVNPRWYQIDASDQILGRLATRVATILMGKHRPEYTPHVDCGDFVVVTNCSRLQVTGRKLDQTTYDRYSGYPGGLKQISRSKLAREKPELLFQLAVRRMLPKNALGRHMLDKLKAYPGAEHPHQAQQPEPISPQRI